MQCACTMAQSWRRSSRASCYVGPKGHTPTRAARRGPVARNVYTHYSSVVGSPGRPFVAMAVVP